jgi:hypothetical protein
MLAEKGIRVNGGARADLDAAHPVDHARGHREEFRQAGADEAGRAAGRTGDGLCDARRSAVELHLRHHGRSDRREALHLMPGLQHAVTPGGRYFVVRGRLLRMSDPDLAAQDKERLVKQLMDARRPAASADAFFS